MEILREWITLPNVIIVILLVAILAIAWDSIKDFVTWFTK